MLRFYNYMIRKMKANFTDLDLGMLKTYGFLGGLIVGAYFPEFIKNNLIIIGGVLALLFFRYVYLIFIKKDI